MSNNRNSRSSSSSRRRTTTSTSATRNRYHETKFTLDDGLDVYVADLHSNVAVIVTHPWGVLGGNRHNNVVVATCLYFQQKLGITTIRFDFVGTQIGRGYMQVEQVQRIARAAVDGKFVVRSSDGESDDPASFVPPKHILLVGYSYGSLISSSASCDIPECIGVIQIAPPFGVQHWLLLFCHSYHLQQATKRHDLKRLLILGTNDNFTSEATFRSTIETYYPLVVASTSSSTPSNNTTTTTTITTGAVIKDADHFFHGRERDVMDVIGQWLLTAYEQQCGPNGDLKQFRNYSP